MDVATRTESGALRLRAGAVSPRSAPRATRPWRSHLALVVAVAIVALPLGFAADARGRELAASASGASGLAMRVDADDLAPRPAEPRMLVDLPAPGEVPVFPVAEPMSWVESLGEYFAWEVWVGGAPGRDGPESCLLLASDSGTRSKCVTRERAARGALFVSLPYALIPSGARPDGMTSGQSVGFWWAPDGIVIIVLGPTG